MKILFWLDHFYPIIGGVQVIALPILQALRERGHEIVVVTSRRDPTIPASGEYAGIPIRRFDFWDALESQDLLQVQRERSKFLRFLGEFSPDLIHLFGVGPTQFFYLNTRHRVPVPLLVTLQDEDSNWLRQTGQDSLLYHVLQAADWAVTVAQIEMDRLIQLLPFLQSHIACLYNALPMPALEPAPLPAEPRFMTLGRLAPEKSFDLAIRAFALAAPRFPAARLEIVGDGDERPKLEALANELGLTHQVEFVGWVMPPQIPAQINRVTAVVLSSQTEGLPLAGLEAAQMARPLIAPRVGGLPELVVDRTTGFLTAPGDAADMAHAMEQILENPAQAVAMGQAARRHIAAHFNFDTVISTYDELYQRLPTNVHK